MLVDDPELTRTGYIITEDGCAGVPECIAWFTVIEEPAAPPRYVFDSVEPASPDYEEEDDT